jgi:hypothetical protein
MKTSKLLIVVISVLVLQDARSQTLPIEIKALLDQRYPQWQFTIYHRDPHIDSSESFVLMPDAGNFLECNLNLDSIPDYALAITAPRQSHIMEFFLAAIFQKGSYHLYGIDSSRGCCAFQMRLNPAHTDVFILGDYDNEIVKYGLLDKDENTIKFPTDTINLMPLYEKNSDVSYVFINGKFYSILSAD